LDGAAHQAPISHSKGAKELMMKATNLPMEDDRGIIAVIVNLFHAALVPSAREASVPPAARKPTWFERFDRWASKSRQRDRERYLAGSNDVFELERRLRTLERQPYF
jgi:hypothetical protein